MDDPRWLELFNKFYDALCDTGLDCEEAAEKAGIKADEVLINEKIAAQAA